MQSCEGMAADPATDALVEEQFFSRPEVYQDDAIDEAPAVPRPASRPLHGWVGGAVTASLALCVLALISPDRNATPAIAPLGVTSLPSPEALRSRPIAPETLSETEAAKAALSSARLDDAIRSAARAVAVDPGLSDSWRVLAEAYRRSNREAAAQKANAGCRTFARVGSCAGATVSIAPR